MGKLIALAPKLPPAAAEKTYTEMALEALDEARAHILAADTAGKPCTHVVICMAAAYQQGTEERLVTDCVMSGRCDSLAAVGVMHVVSQDLFGG